MRAIVLFVVFLGAAESLSASEPEPILRLKRLLAEATDDSVRVGIYNDLAWEYSFSAYDSAACYTEQAIEVSNKISDAYWQAVSLEMKAILMEMSGRSEEALKLYLKVIPLRESVGGRGLENTYNNMAVIFRNQDNFAKAYKYFELSYRMEMEAENAEGIAGSLVNMALVKMRTGDLDSIPDLLRKAVRISSANDDFKLLSTCYLNLADYFTLTQKADSTLYYYKQAYVISDRLGDLASKSVAAYGLGEASHKRGDHHRALAYLDEAEALGRKVNSLQYILRAHGLKAEVLFAQKRYRKAFEEQQNFLAAKDSMISLEMLGITNELETKYESERKERQITELRLTMAEGALNAEASRNQRNFLFFLSVLMVMVAGFITYRYRYQQKTAMLLTEKNKTIELALKDRETLLKEIHHRVKNNLQVVSSLLSIQGREITDSKALEAVNESRNRVKSMALIHQYLYGDHDLKSIDMQQYIVQLSKSLFNAYKVDHDLVQLRTDVEPILLDVDTAVPLGIILNELVTNSLKYAFPEGREGALMVSLKEVNGELELRVKDDGVGLDAVDPSDLSFGMKLLNAFKSKLNAKFEVVSQNGVEAIYTIRTYKRSWAEITAS